MPRRSALSRLLIPALAAALAAGAARAADPVPQHNSTAFWFENWIGLSNATLTVLAPGGQVTALHAPSGTPVFQLDRGGARDGVWRYELTAASDKTRAIVDPIDNGRGDAARDTVAVPVTLTGQFTVSRGVIIIPDDITEGDG